MELGLTDKTVLVTGGGRGIGAACVRGFAEQGARVIAVARDEVALEALQRQIKSLEVWAMDVTGDAFVTRLGELSRLDVLINNAGTNDPKPVAEVSTASLDEMLNLNVRAVYLASQAAVRVMLKRGGGAIVNMSSQMGHIGAPSRTVYCMTKHAVEGLTKAMAVELASDRIRVNSVAPTFVETELTKPMLDDPAFASYVARMIPQGELGRMQDVVNAVLYLASDLSQSVTGHSLLVDGGWTAQ